MRYSGTGRPCDASHAAIAPATFLTAGRSSIRARQSSSCGVVAGHDRALPLAKELRHEEGNVGVGIFAGEERARFEPRVHLLIEPGSGAAGGNGGRIRGRFFETHEPDDVRKVNLVGLELELARLGSARGRFGPERRNRKGILEILEDLG